MTFSESLRSVLEVRRAPGRFPVALQAGVAMGIPVVGFALAGRSDLGLLASSGAFVALYLSDRSRRRRAAMLPLVALGLTLSATVGSLAAATVIGETVAVALVALAASVVMLGLRTGPPAGFMITLIAGISGHLAAPRALGGDALSPLLIVGMLAVGAAIAYLVVIAPLALPGVRRRDAARHASLEPVRFGLDRIDLVVLSRLAAGILLAALVAVPLGSHRGYWVIGTVVAILQNGHRLRFGAIRAVHRVVGTFLGIGVFALIALWHPEGVVLGLLVALLQFVVEMLVVRNYGLALVFITPLALSISTASVADPLPLALDRTVDTAIGGVIAVVVLLGAWLVGRARGAQSSM